MIFSSPIVLLKDRVGAFLINISQFNGNMAAVAERVPAGVPGIYAWFRSFNFSEDENNFFDEIIVEIEKPKFYPRQGTVKPYYNVTVSSGSWMSESKKQKLKNAMKNKEFSDGLRNALNSSIVFQTPLYIGKTTDLQQRVTAHLASNSPLRSRLNEVGIDVEQTILMVVPSLPDTDLECETPSNLAEEFSQEEEGMEAIYEEIFSRLFLPQFTIRLG
jgi:hypothetical protein